MLYYKGYIKASIVESNETELVVYHIEIENSTGYVFRELKKYSIPIIADKEYSFVFKPTISPKFGKTHVLTKIGVDSYGLDHLDGQGNVIADRRILIHGGKHYMHSSGCWLPFDFSTQKFISGFRLPLTEEVTFALIGRD